MSQQQSDKAPPTLWSRLLGGDPAQFTPKLVTTLREGYTAEMLRHDVIAGFTVAILALPLSMAIAIGSGVKPEVGLITSVIAGFLISALGGTRYQIGGPAAAFIVIVFSIISAHGLDGLQTATFLAGFILVAAGVLKLGSYVRYVPEPVILGFTSGIGAIIAVSQLRDFLGLDGRATLPAEVVEKIHALWHIRGTFNPTALLVGLGTLAAIVGLKAWRPKWPGLLIAVFGASALVALLHLNVDTVGSRFGGIPQSLPSPTLPNLGWSKITEVLPSAFTLAFLIAVESLLTAVAADAMTGRRHRSNMEVVAQGVANIAAPLFGGMPATGVIARTGTNIQAGARSPVAGVLHALFVLGFMLLLAPLASYLALPCLAAVLMNVAWRLLDIGEVSHFLKSAPFDDRLVLAATLLLTVFVDLNAAIGVGVVMAALLFMHRMAESQSVTFGKGGGVDEEREGEGADDLGLPANVGRLTFKGPLFFGGATRMSASLNSLGTWPSVLILDMQAVPLIDATAITAVQELTALAGKNKCHVIVAGLDTGPLEHLKRSGLFKADRITAQPTLTDAATEARRRAAGKG